MVVAALCIDEEFDLDFREEGLVDAKVRAGIELQAPDHLPAIMFVKVVEDFRKRRPGFAVPLIDASIGRGNRRQRSRRPEGFN
ncbi:MAG: hypothetical protein Q9180_003886 [Flavoplaca navasiana]